MLTVLPTALLQKAGIAASPEFEPKDSEVEPELGRPDQPVRVLAFSAGAYDTVIQLGVVHALLVGRFRAPDMVVGVSVGAVNAVALAEVMQAGSGLPPESASAAQVAKLRQVMEEFKLAPRELVAAALPDPYQVEAQRPLAPARLPLHDQQERRHRNLAIRSRSGVINLFNDLLALDFRVGTLARAIRATLGLRGAAELRGLARPYVTFSEGLRLWWLAGKNLVPLAPVAWRVGGVLALAVIRGIAYARNQLLLRAWRWLGEKLRWPGAEEGLTAGALIFLSPLRRRFARFTAAVVGFVIVLAAWLLAPLVLVSPLLGFVAVALSLEGWMSIRILHIAMAGALAGVSVWTVVGFLLAGERGPRVRRRLLHWLFTWYDVANGWFDPHALRERFVRLFDPDYYGRPAMDNIVESIFLQQKTARRDRTDRRSFSDYAEAKPPIHVGVVAASVGTGSVTVLPSGTTVVDGLLAATALPPFLPAQELDDGWYVDGSLVVNEPTAPLMGYLRTRVHREASAVHIYPVVDVPLEQGQLGGSTEYARLTSIVTRALQLERFRDATLDRQMTHLYSRALRPDGPARQAAVPPEPGEESREYIRAWVYPIETEKPLELTRRLATAESDLERRRLIDEAVADGCRATLERLLEPTVRTLAGIPAKSSSLGCSGVVAKATGAGAELPGSDPALGPGLAELCKACALNRDFPVNEPKRSPQQLSVRAAPLSWPVWPNSSWAAKTPEPAGEYAPASLSAYDEEVRKALERRFEIQEQAGVSKWPLDRQTPGCGLLSARSRPLVNLLFSGGVFRGVYLMGVVNALSELRIQPDLIAGSSVGSITAAMAASLFRVPYAKRSPEIARLAATFLALDRLILTDRFAEFVRSLTLRAAATTFSIRELDQVFRTYDRARSGTFSLDLRRVLAGLERLFYVSPFEVRELTQAVRDGRTGRFVSLVTERVQGWLDRWGVGMEVLGAEPLAFLIDMHVLKGNPNAPSVSSAVPLHLFDPDGIFFLVTATNLTQGRLEYLGAEQGIGSRNEAQLLESLLASSAFPGVFRPRSSWEVMPRSRSRDQHIDGGVMDNLPLDAVAQFLNGAAGAGLLASRPRVSTLGEVPHLMFTASLEVDRRPAQEGEEEIARSWFSVYRRSKEFSYNRKVDSYARMQRHLRGICRTQPESGAGLLDLEVLAVKPRWLCETFGFHPMLGFRRSKQAASIAHGCATTIVRFQQLRSCAAGAKWTKAWGVADSVGAVEPGRDPLRPRRVERDHCWFRPAEPCPFSRSALAKALIPDATRREVAEIYRACGRPETHQER